MELTRNRSLPLFRGLFLKLWPGCGGPGCDLKAISSDLVFAGAKDGLQDVTRSRDAALKALNETLVTETYAEMGFQETQGWWQRRQ
jgi:hypothetical protein